MSAVSGSTMTSSSAAGGAASSSTGSSGCPRHSQNSQGSNCSLCASWINLEKERKRLALQQERLDLDKQLIKAERKNNRRSNQISAQAQGTEISRLETELKKLQQKHEHQMEALQNQLNSERENGKMQELEWKLKIQQQENDLQETRQLQQIASRDAEMKLESLKMKNDELKTQLEELGKQHARDFEQRVGELQEQLNQVNDELNHKSEENDRLTVQLNNHALAQQDEMDELHDELALLKAEKVATGKRIQELESRMQEVHAKNDDEDDDEEDEAMEELREQLERVQFERENYAMQVQKLEQRCKALESQESVAATMPASTGVECANCEDLEEEVYELKLKLNKRQIELQKEIKELQQKLEKAEKNGGGERSIESVGTAAAVPAVSTKTAKELQEIRKMEVEKRKVEAKFLSLEAFQKTTEKEKEALEEQLEETRNDLHELAKELDKAQKEARQALLQAQLDQEALHQFKSQMDRLKEQQDRYLLQQEKDHEEFNALVDSLGKKQRQVFDETIPVMAHKLTVLEEQLNQVEKMDRPAPIPEKPLRSDNAEEDRQKRRQNRTFTERQPPLTKMDSRKNKHVTEFDFQGGKQSGKYTGFLNATQRPEGHGILRVDNGDVYEGEWENGLRHGQGVYTWYEGDLYTGPWFEGRRHGHGVFVFSDGRLYDGEYRMGLREGRGMFVWPYGAKYEGSYLKDKRNGDGEYRYADGRVYRGEYKDDRPHGYGVEVAKDGSVLYDGQWAFGEFVGDGNASVMGSIVDGGR